MLFVATISKYEQWKLNIYHYNLNIYIHNQCIYVTFIFRWFWCQNSVPGGFFWIFPILPSAFLICIPQIQSHHQYYFPSKCPPFKTISCLTWFSFHPDSIFQYVHLPISFHISEEPLQVGLVENKFCFRYLWFSHLTSVAKSYRRFFQFESTRSQKELLIKLFDLSQAFVNSFFFCRNTGVDLYYLKWPCQGQRGAFYWTVGAALQIH